jgi:L-rhamnose mutarotase
MGSRTALEPDAPATQVHHPAQPKHEDVRAQLHVKWRFFGKFFSSKPCPVALAEYKRLHAAVWPDVPKQIAHCHIRNYSIYLRTLGDGRPYLFSYFEYTGEDFDANLARMATDPTTQRWWACCRPCQQPLADCAPFRRRWPARPGPRSM